MPITPKTITLAACLMLAVSAFAIEVKPSIDPYTGALVAFNIAGDESGMNWIIRDDGTPMERVSSEYAWGLGYFTLNGRQECRWQTPVSISENGSNVLYREDDIEISISRIQDGDDWVETYTLTNVGTQTAALSGIGIFTPFDDNYPDALTCMERRCHAHIWEGGNGAYVNLLRMGAKGPHLGMVVTEGGIDGYDVFERDPMKWSSQFRGVFALRMPDATLEPGGSTSVSWRIFAHNGDDFKNAMLARSGVRVSADRYVIKKGGHVKISLEGAQGHVSLKVGDREVRVKRIDGTHCAKVRLKGLGSHRFEFTYDGGKTTWGEVLVISSEKKLIAQREQFILENQQMKDKDDPRFGAFMVYDNELGEIFLNDRPTCSPLDRDEGAERMGMGIVLAKESIRKHDKSLEEPLVDYATFIREKLQTEDFVTYSEVEHQSRNRGYNYMWVAMFDFEMFRVTGDSKYAVDGYRTMKSFYSQFGYKFYAIHIPVMLGLEVLEEAGMTAERDDLLKDYINMGDTFVERGLNYPKHEVNYEQSIVAPAISFLCQLYLVTGDSKYLDEAGRQMPVLEAFCGDQPTYHKNGIAIRHWDGYWFGKREMLGDCFPHYWSVLTGEAFYFYGLCTGEKQWKDKAENIVRNNLCLFDEQGHGSCAYVYPNHVNGETAQFYDVFANDQDFALVSYYLINYDIL